MHINHTRKIIQKANYLVLGSPLPFPDVGSDNSLRLFSQAGVGAELGGGAGTVAALTEFVMAQETT